MEDKVCTKCREPKPLDSFYRRWRVRTKVPSHWVYDNVCDACQINKSLTWQKDNWEHVKEYRSTDEYKRYARNEWLGRVYHKTLEWYETQYQKQNGLCAICGKPERCLGSGRKTKSVLVVDHDHSCCSGNKSCGKCVRSLICDDCNHVLGFSHDSPEVLESANLYLKKYKEVQQEI